MNKELEALRQGQYEIGTNPAFRRIDSAPITGKTPSCNQ